MLTLQVKFKYFHFVTLSLQFSLFVQKFKLLFDTYFWLNENGTFECTMMLKVLSKNPRNASQSKVCNFRHFFRHLSLQRTFSLYIKLN